MEVKKKKQRVLPLLNGSFKVYSTDSVDVVRFTRDSLKIAPFILELSLILAISSM